MRAFLVLFSLLGAFAAQSLPRVSVGGSDYIRLDEWAQNAGLRMHWAKAEGVISLTGASARAELTVDSRRAEISGVNIWLSLPVINRNGTALISVVDADTTLDPILFPKRSESRLTTICIDPGHGGKDTGKVDGHKYEKTYTLLLARQVEDLLKRAGFKVVLTRDSDTYVDLAARTQAARRAGADLFVSLHYNAAEGGVRGLEVYCLAPAGMNSSNEGGGKSAHPRETGNARDDQNILLAYDVDKAITTSVPLEDRGTKRSHFEVLRDAPMPAILIEGGFMSNPADARNIYDSTFRKRMAQAIVDGILAYKRTVGRS